MYANYNSYPGFILRKPLCHQRGTVVPPAWHSCANGMAQLCHSDGTNLAQ